MHVPQINEAEFPFLHLTSIGDGAWRISDIRYPEHDSRSVIGVIERVEGLFEITSMLDPRRRTPVESLHEALRRLVDADPVTHPHGHLHPMP
ncbi:hypothetical protein HQQ80_12690 [Microbacteriaceae bacterium VKM Ac-2855]|nr:hypothetical protein [Microbacteriaceae bacterium VKM Ac-2855]